MVDHVDSAGHLPNWQGAKVLKCGLDRRKRKALEAMYIRSRKKNINKRTGDIVWAAAAPTFCIQA